MSPFLYLLVTSFLGALCGFTRAFVGVSFLKRSRFPIGRFYMNTQKILKKYSNQKKSITCISCSFKLSALVFEEVVTGLGRGKRGLT